jgi:hypothetical protein
MKPEHAERMNELARMSPEERQDALASEIFGPGFGALLPAIPTPQPIGEGE